MGPVAPCGAPFVFLVFFGGRGWFSKQKNTYTKKGTCLFPWLLARLECAEASWIRGQNQLEPPAAQLVGNAFPRKGSMPLGSQMVLGYNEFSHLKMPAGPSGVKCLLKCAPKTVVATSDTSSTQRGCRVAWWLPAIPLSFQAFRV